ncbi:MAG: DUF4412 domain-containing protein [Flavobacteriales bacterium]|nr:DUF4412 domain-containing protein [Flavobacteriales bacterium]
MRLPCLALLFAPIATIHAQDLQELLQQAGGVQVTFAEDDTPYAPLGFTGSFRFEVHNYAGDQEQKNSPMDIFYAFTDDRMAFRPTSPDIRDKVTTVFDLKEKRMYMLTENAKGERTGMKMKMLRVNVDKGANDGAEDVQVERTDETRTIEGHTCRKYLARSSDGHSEAWVAEDIAFDLKKAFGRMVSGQRAQQWQRMPYGQGLVMEMTWWKADSNERMTLTTHDLRTGSVDETVFDTSGYTIQDLTALPVFGR